MEDIFEKLGKSLSLRLCFYVIHIYLSTYLQYRPPILCFVLLSFFLSSTCNVVLSLSISLSIIKTTSLHSSVLSVKNNCYRCSLMFSDPQGVCRPVPAWLPDKCAALCLVELAGTAGWTGRPAHSRLHSTPQSGLAPATGDQSTSTNEIWRHLHLHLHLTTIMARPGLNTFYQIFLRLQSCTE